MIDIRDVSYLIRYYRDNKLSFLRGIGVKKPNNTTPDYERILRTRDAGQKIYNPRTIVNTSRLDIAAKTLFARSYIERNTSSWPEKVYKEHLRSWNNFYEDNPLKEKYEDFKNSFIGIIDSYIYKKMDHVTSPVVVNKNNNVLRNGAHRVAAAIVTDNLVNVIEKGLARQRLWNADFFRGKLEEKPEFMLDELYIDAMTIEYVSLFPENLFAVVIFPAAKGHRVEAKTHLESIGKIVNHRTFGHDEFDGKNVVRQLYYGEEWNYEGSEGVSNKATWCFDGRGDLQIYIIESDLSKSERVKEKEYLRSIWGIDKNSIHMTDTSEEVNVAARMFFHESTRQTLRRYYSFTPATLKLFNQYRELLPKDFITRDKFCIDSSAVMDFLGLRQAADIDYISVSRNVKPSIKGVEEHGEEYIQYYPISKDEILYNPENYFYYAGCKITSLDLIKSMKINRSRRDRHSREKDIKDLHLIETYQKTHSDSRLE